MERPRRPKIDPFNRSNPRRGERTGGQGTGGGSRFRGDARPRASVGRVRGRGPRRSSSVAPRRSSVRAPAKSLLIQILKQQPAEERAAGGWTARGGRDEDWKSEWKHEVVHPRVLLPPFSLLSRPGIAHFRWPGETIAAPVGKVMMLG